MPDDEKKKEPERKEEEAPAEKKAAVPATRLVKKLAGVAIFLVIILVAAVVAYFVTIKIQAMASESPVVPIEGAGGGIKEGVEPKIFDCGEPFTVVLVDPEGRGTSHTFRVTVYLAVNPEAKDPTAEKIMEELTRRRRFIRNAIYDVLQGIDPTRFQRLGMQQVMGDLKAQIQKAVQDQLPSGYTIQQVLFDNPIYQAG